MKKKVFTKIRLVFVLVLTAAIAFILVSCKAKENNDDKKQAKVVVAKIQTPITRLYFTGSLTPIATIPVMSPVDGRLQEIQFDYGAAVKKDQVLVVLSSKTLADNFRKAVADFLQKKDSYDIAVSTQQGNEALYKAGIISKEAFVSGKNQYENTTLSYFQSRFALEKILEKAKLEYKPIEELKLEDIKQIVELLRRRFNNIPVESPASGVVLFPVGDQGNGGGGGNGDSDQSSGRLQVGMQIKEGQTMLNIGDLSGLAAKIEVSEININRIKRGMKAIVSGDAFPGVTLNGYVAQVASQANPAESGGSSLSMFNVLIKVPKLTAEQSKTIHVGMTAKIEIDIKESPIVMLPLQAIITKNGNHFVKVLDKSGQPQQVPVTIGSSTPEGNVGIVTGVKSGDKVLMNDKI